MTKPAVFVSARTDEDGCVIVVTPTPTHGPFDGTWLEQLLDSAWYDELGQLQGVNGDIALAPRELLIGHSPDDQDTFLTIVLPKLREAFTVVNH